MRGRAHSIDLGVLRAACKLHWCRSGANNQADTLAICQTNECQEEADTDAGGELDAARNGTSKPLSHTKEGQAEEDEALDEDGGEGDFIGNRTISVRTN